eukprot:Amastigsp_a852013_5.p6 type:complete len:113 gc:universal Amastigsp_a852013_5:476-814(+)
MCQRAYGRVRHAIAGHRRRRRCNRPHVARCRGAQGRSQGRNLLWACGTVRDNDARLDRSKRSQGRSRLRDFGRGQVLRVDSQPRAARVWLAARRRGGHGLPSGDCCGRRIGS